MFISQVHFSDEMWEKTREGKRRLKSTATPTIFHNRILENTCIKELTNSVTIRNDYDIPHTQEITINEGKILLY